MNNIIFMGTPDFAIPAINAIHLSQHQICAVVTNPDKPYGRGRKLKPSAIKMIAQDLKYPILQPEKLNDSNFLNEIEKLKPSLLVVVAFKKIPPQLYNLATHGAINIHASLLPKYRGAAPIHHAILNGERETGVTTFQINDKIDTGNIICQEKISIKSDETTGSLWTKLSQLGQVAILKTLDQLDTGKINYILQDNLLATKAPKIFPKDLKIDWDKSATQIHNQIRAYSPKPGAFTTLNGKRIKLFSTSVIEPINEQKKDQLGRIRINNNNLTIMTGNGILNVSEIQSEGKSRMDVKSYLSGNKIEKEAICL
jgi:methionyl-tRNA formyltransferase